MKDYGIDVFAQCIDGKVVFVKKPLVFKDDSKPFVTRINIAKKPKELVRAQFPKVVFAMHEKSAGNEE